MTDVRIYAGTLTASREDRTVTGLLLPFGEVGNTSLGKFSVDAGVFEIPADPMVVGLDVDHERERPVGRATSAMETPEGIVATFAIARTPEGDQVLDEIESGERRSLSAEVAEVVIRSGKAIAGRLFGAAVCAKGAFPSAALYASDVGAVPLEGIAPVGPSVGLALHASQILAAGAAGSVPKEEATVPNQPTVTLDAEAVTYTTEAAVVETISDGETVTTITTTQAATETYESAPADSTETPEPAPADEDTAEASDDAEDPEADEADTEEEATVPETLTATVPAGSMAARTAQRKAAPSQHNLRSVATLLASAYRDKSSGAGASTLLAALDEITAADAFDVVTDRQWIGELWDGKSYVTKYADKIGAATLTGPKVIGWRFVDTKAPTVASYAGFPNEPTSNNVDTEAVEVTVSRLAGAWTVDRIHRDFPSPEFWQAFFRKATEDYARKRDAAVLAEMVSDATAVTAGAAVQPGVSEAAIKIVDGALSMIDYATPTFAIVGSDLYREFLLTRKDDSLEYLGAALGLDEGSALSFPIVPSASGSLTNKVLVGSREAMTLHELPGVPVRVDAESIATGGLDQGLFGYYAIMTHNAKGLALVADA